MSPVSVARRDACAPGSRGSDTDAATEARGGAIGARPLSLAVASAGSTMRVGMTTGSSVGSARRGSGSSAGVGGDASLRETGVAADGGGDSGVAGRSAAGACSVSAAPGSGRNAPRTRRGRNSGSGAVAGAAATAGELAVAGAANIGSEGSAAAGVDGVVSGSVGRTRPTGSGIGVFAGTRVSASARCDASVRGSATACTTRTGGSGSRDVRCDGISSGAGSGGDAFIGSPKSLVDPAPGASATGRSTSPLAGGASELHETAPRRRDLGSGGAGVSSGPSRRAPSSIRAIPRTSPPGASRLRSTRSRASVGAGACRDARPRTNARDAAVSSIAPAARSMAGSPLHSPGGGTSRSADGSASG